MKIGFLGQPGDGCSAPDVSGSLGTWTWEVARRMARTNQVLVFSHDFLSLKRRILRRLGSWPKRIPRAADTDHCPMAESYEQVRIARVPPTWDDLLFNSIKRMHSYGNPRRPGFASKANHFIYAFRAAQAFRAHCCDVIHIHNYSQFVPTVRRLNPQAKIVLHMNCDWLTQVDHKIIGARLEKADAVIGCSDYVTNNVRNSFPQYAHRCWTVYNGVDLEQFRSNEDAQKRLPGCRIVFVGRVSPEKGVHILVEAFESVAAIRPNAHLEIVGGPFVAPIDFIVNLSDDPMVQRLKRFFENDYFEHLKSSVSGAIAGNVSFAGAQRHAAVAEYLRNADLFVVPSVWGEPFPLATLEAMAMGIPVVASGVGGLPEAVQDGVTGLLVEPDNPSKLAQAIVRLLDDVALRRKMGSAARVRVAKMFSWESTTERLARLYSALQSPCLGQGDLSHEHRATSQP
jgi:glycosyltransferase involved in cell wall biosynthesis